MNSGRIKQGTVIESITIPLGLQGEVIAFSHSRLWVLWSTGAETLEPVEDEDVAFRVLSL